MISFQHHSEKLKARKDFFKMLLAVSYQLSESQPLMAESLKLKIDA
jgi:hypothetical protein